MTNIDTTVILFSTPGETVILFSTPGETVIVFSTLGVDGYRVFYPGCRRLLCFLPWVPTVIVFSTPGVDGYRVLKRCSNVKRVNTTPCGYVVKYNLPGVD